MTRFFLCLLTLGSFASAQHHDPAHGRVLQMSGMAFASEDDPHIKMTPQWQSSEADRLKAQWLYEASKEATKLYQHVEVAYRDDYIEFPGAENAGDEVHLVHIGRSFLENWRIEPKEPGALLYRRNANGSLSLIGAMFTAPATAGLNDLNARVPLSVARWHLHINLCIPDPIWDASQWLRTLPNGSPIFGPESPISSRLECDQVGGDFHEHMFGWMVHVYFDVEHPWHMQQGH